MDALIWPREMSLESSKRSRNSVSIRLGISLYGQESVRHLLYDLNEKSASKRLAIRFN
jgi:hypothetical protein